MVPTFITSTAASLNVWTFVLAAHSAALWLNLPQYNHLPSANLFAHASAEILHLPTLRFIDAGPLYPATVSAGAVSGAFGGAGTLGEAKSTASPLFWAPYTACRWWIWLSRFWQTVTNTGCSSAISLTVNEFFISSNSPIGRACSKAKPLQSRSAAITWNSA